MCVRVWAHVGLRLLEGRNGWFIFYPFSLKLLFCFWLCHNLFILLPHCLLCIVTDVLCGSEPLQWVYCLPSNQLCFTLCITLLDLVGVHIDVWTPICILLAPVFLSGFKLETICIFTGSIQNYALALPHTESLFWDWGHNCLNAQKYQSPTPTHISNAFFTPTAFLLCSLHHNQRSSHGILWLIIIVSTLESHRYEWDGDGHSLVQFIISNNWLSVWTA